MVRRPSAFSGQTLPFSGPWRATDSLLIAIAALVGFAFVFILPPFDGTDELYHWLRVVQISSGHLLAPSMGPNAWGGVIDKHAYDFELWFLAKFQHGDRIQAGDAWTLARQLGALPPQNALVEFSSTASFSPLAYLPQSLGVAVARAVGANLLTQLYAGRIANLIVYLAGAVATLRLLPYGRLAFFILATMPTAMELAATQSADPLNFMLPALFIAWCWKYRTVERPNKSPIGIVLAGFTIGLALLKPLYLIFAVFSAIIPANRFGGARQKLISIASALLIGAAICAAWNWAYPFVPGKYWHTGADPAQMISAVIADPAVAFHMAANTIRDWTSIWWIDGYEHFGGNPAPYSFFLDSSPAWIALYLLLALCLAEESPRRDLPLIGASLAIATGFGVLLLTAFLIGFTKPGSPTIDGIQGRYFYLIFLLVGVALVTASPLGKVLHKLRVPLFLCLMGLEMWTASMGLNRFYQLWHL